MSKLMLGLAAWVIPATVAAAMPVVVGFERINPSYPSPVSTPILNFYDGGVSGAGTSGINYGFSFSPNAVAVCLNIAAGSCSNASAGGLGPATSRRAALGLSSGGTAVMDFSAAYTGAVGFRFQVAPGYTAFLQAWDAPGGTGTMLASLPLSGTSTGCPAYNATICPFAPGGLGFLTGVQSLVFGGTPGRVVFDDLTFGAGNDPLSPPGVLPEPASWALMLTGFLLTGSALRRRTAARA